MAYNQQLVDRIRETLVDFPKVEERFMFGGVCFMLDDKMCIGVVKDEIMCRINPDLEGIVHEKNGCRPMDFTGKSMKGFVFVSEEGFKRKHDFDYWVNLCIEFNPIAKATKKKVKKK